MKQSTNFRLNLIVSCVLFVTLILSMISCSDTKVSKSVDFNVNFEYQGNLLGQKLNNEKQFKELKKEEEALRLTLSEKMPSFFDEKSYNDYLNENHLREKLADIWLKENSILISIGNIEDQLIILLPFADIWFKVGPIASEPDGDTYYAISKHGTSIGGRFPETRYELFVVPWTDKLPNPSKLSKYN